MEAVQPWTILSSFEPSFHLLQPPIHPTIGYYDEQRRHSETGQFRPPMVRSRDVESVAKTNKLTRDSIQEALRIYLQPIENDDPQLDYDTTHIQQRNEDLTSTLIFVRFYVPLITT